MNAVKIKILPMMGVFLLKIIYATILSVSNLIRKVR